METPKKSATKASGKQQRTKSMMKDADEEEKTDETPKKVKGGKKPKEAKVVPQVDSELPLRSPDVLYEKKTYYDIDLVEPAPKSGDDEKVATLYS